MLLGAYLVSGGQKMRPRQTHYAPLIYLSHDLPKAEQEGPTTRSRDLIADMRRLPHHAGNAGACLELGECCLWEETSRHEQDAPLEGQRLLHRINLALSL